MNIVALADFHAVANHGGFSAVERLTGVSKTTLSRRVHALEVELGVRLFERGARSMRLTEEGRALRASTIDLLNQIDDVANDISGRAGTPRGRLRISIQNYFSQLWFGAFAAGFIAAHPMVSLEVVVQDRFVDPVNEEFDVLIRVNPSADSPLVGHKMVSAGFVVAAAPSIRPPATEDEPVAAAMLSASPHDRPWIIQKGTELKFGSVRPTPVIRSSTIGLVRASVIAGAGIGLLPEWMVASELASGKLISWGKLEQEKAELWVLYPSRRFQSGKVTAFVQALLDFHARRKTAGDPSGLAGADT